MAAFIVLIAITAVAAMALGGFLCICRGIRRTDRWGSLRPEEAPYRRHLLAYACRWDENTPALA